MFFYLEKKQRAYHISRARGLTPDPHLHSHIEIVVMMSGESVGVADSRSDSMNPGDMFVAFPNQIHHYHDVTRPLDGALLIIAPDLCPEFSRIFKTMIPESPVMKNATSNPKILWAVNTLMDLKDNDIEYSETEVRGSMLVLLSEFFRNMKLVENASCDNDLVKDIINYCYENYDSDISLQSISEALHISRYYISHIFSRRLQTGFNDYINSLRIRKACELLKSGDNQITEIAYTVGYSSPRTFNRCFMNIRGMTPKEYRAKAHESKAK